MKNLRIVAIFLYCFLTPPREAYPRVPEQDQETCGGVVGRVTTEDGAVIPRADIRAVNKKTKESLSIQTNGEGEYRICLGPGLYDVFATALSFKQAKRKSIRVDKSGKSIIDLVLKRGKPVVVDEGHP
jgi:hypothetical protein